jgi:hypothetical protein
MPFSYMNGWAGLHIRRQVVTLLRGKEVINELLKFGLSEKNAKFTT